MNMHAAKLCLVEDDVIMGESLQDRFGLEGFAVDWFQTARAAIENIEQRDYDVVISDIRLPDLTGEQMFEQLLERERFTPPVLFITAYGAIDRAVHLLRLGAVDYVTKPFDLEEMVEKVRALCSPQINLSEAPSDGPTLGVSAPMQELDSVLPRLARYSTTILITGESGVGKEELARRLHLSRTPGSAAPFLAVNCGALPEGLIEAELFGHEKGAFTGAVRARRGVFEQASGGTLFLDEIGDMPLATQVKLLRAIQDKVIVRVGGEGPIPVDLRLICATSRDLKKMVEEGRFRDELYYRINVIHLHVPPLRERREDILWLARLFLHRHALEHSEQQKSLDPLAEHALLEYGWPGNVRELKHCLERACILAKGPVLRRQDLFACHDGSARTAETPGFELSQHLRAYEREQILQALERQQWHINKTAMMLGISRKNLWEKMKKLGITSKTGPRRNTQQ